MNDEPYALDGRIGENRLVDPTFGDIQHGFIDYYGFSRGSKGWWLGGWIPFSFQPDRFLLDNDHATVSLSFRKQEITTSGRIAVFDRDDIKNLGRAFLLFVAAPPIKDNVLVKAEITIDEFIVPLRLGALADHLREPSIVDRSRSDLGAAPESDVVVDLRQLLLIRRDEIALEELKNVYFAIDEAILCKPSSIILIGWMFDPHNEIARIVFHCGVSEFDIDVKRMIRTDRSDVSSAFEDRYGRVDPRCGFVLFLQGMMIDDDSDDRHIEIVTRNGNTASQTLPDFRLTGLNAIKKALGSFSVRYDEVDHAFSCLGPGIQMLNADRIARRPQVSKIDFGPQAINPLCTIIVPIYGRFDFLEYQSGFFSEVDFSRFELIYVLDDPPRRDEFLALAGSSFARFGVPLQVLLLSHNVGFAPANNIALERSRGRYICFLNSDVMPGEPNWLVRLIADLEDVPSLGIVGPLLMFEDDTIQHAGMVFERLDEFSGWFFPRHASKGWIPNQTGLQFATAITGACMVMRRDIANHLGGFDETYIVGDFERFRFVSACK